MTTEQEPVAYDINGATVYIKPPVYGAAPPQQPEQEPVAWMFINKTDGGKCIFNDPFENSYNKDEFDVKPLFTAPPQREWQGLTWAELDLIEKQTRTFNSNCFVDFYIAIEQALKEKNYGTL